MNWLDRTLVHGHYLILCLTEDDFLKTLAHLEIAEVPPFKTRAADARCLFVSTPAGRTATIVTLHDWEGRSPIVVSGLIVHEAVHVFQRFCEDIGEDSPSNEFEAYSIQNIYSTLANDFVRQTGGEDLVVNRNETPE